MKRFLMPVLIGILVFLILFNLINNIEAVFVEDYKILEGSQEIIITLNFNNNTSNTLIFYNNYINGIEHKNQIVTIKYGKFVIDGFDLFFIDESNAKKFYSEFLEKYMGANENER